MHILDITGTQSHKNYNRIMVMVQIYLVKTTMQIILKIISRQMNAI